MSLKVKLLEVKLLDNLEVSKAMFARLLGETTSA
jgi:hypothetical protein